MNSPSPQRRAIIDRQKAIAQEMDAMKHPRVSCAVDFIDPIYKHLDPISVSLQERVKFGGHITSITRSTQLANPNGEFYFYLSQANEDTNLYNDNAQVTKNAILRAQIEKMENRNRRIIKGQKTTLIEKKLMKKDYQGLTRQREEERILEEQ